MLTVVPTGASVPLREAGAVTTQRTWPSLGACRAGSPSHGDTGHARRHVQVPWSGSGHTRSFLCCARVDRPDRAQRQRSSPGGRGISGPPASSVISPCPLTAAQIFWSHVLEKGKGHTGASDCKGKICNMSLNGTLLSRYGFLGWRLWRALTDLTAPERPRRCYQRRAHEDGVGPFLWRRRARPAHPQGCLPCQVQQE